MPKNPFNGDVQMPFAGSDVIPVVKSDTVDFPEMAIGLYVGGAGAISMVTARGATRVITVAANAYIPIGLIRVNSTGTTATNMVAILP